MCYFQVCPLVLFRNILLISNVFINIHEYSNKFVFISADKVRVLCRGFTLISSFSTLRQLSTEIRVIFKYTALIVPQVFIPFYVFIEIDEYSN